MKAIFYRHHRASIFQIWRVYSAMRQIAKSTVPGTLCGDIFNEVGIVSSPQSLLITAQEKKGSE